MEKFIYCFLPMALLLKLFIEKKDKIIDYVIKYLSLCLINNFLCLLFIKLYCKKVTELKITIDFCFKYLILSLVIGVVMAITYKIVKNLIEVKLEVVNEKKKLKNSKK